MRLLSVSILIACGSIGCKYSAQPAVGDGPLVPDQSTPDQMPDQGGADARVDAMADSNGGDANSGGDAMADAGGDAMADAGGDAMPDATPDSATDGGIPPCTPNTWCVEDAPVAGVLLTSVWAVSAGDVFVVGDAGTILRRNNNGWTQLASGTTQKLRGVWAASSTDAWAVGQGGTVLRFDGATWSPVGAFTTDFRAVWGSGPNDVWIAGFGRIVHWNGSAFATQTLPGDVFSVSGTGPSDVWATGESARVDHFNGTAWTTGIKPISSISTYFAIYAIAATNVFVTDALPAKETAQFNGSTWTPRPATNAVFLGMFATGATNLWAAGGPRIGHWDGAAWTIEKPAGDTASLFGISGAGSDVWAVGNGSLILHRN